ncbi:PDZ domain-containing protein 11 isoform X1 [Narcine bancroftii]|uniref:PDZ domain-containing protein 11 isoform X1 n=1 Tax=Narcine bancroftii TaxID=1343680 RepID=UPI0038311472
MSNRVYVDPKGAYDDYQYPVVFLPPYENPPPWIPPHERLHHSDYNNELTQFLPRTIQLQKPSGAQLGFNIRGGKASQLGIFISKVIPDSDADHAGLQEGDQVLAVNDIDFQDIEHSKAVEILKSAKEIIMRVRYFPYRNWSPEDYPVKEKTHSLSKHTNTQPKWRIELTVTDFQRQKERTVH